MMNRTEIQERLGELGKTLVLEMKPEGYWEGRLSSSALGVAVAVAALWFDDPENHSAEIDKDIDGERQPIPHAALSVVYGRLECRQGKLHNQRRPHTVLAERPQKNIRVP